MDQTKDPVENVISPVSIFLALHLLYQGSSSKIKADVENFLELESWADTSALIKRRETLKTNIELANGVVAVNTLGMKTPYQEALRYLGPQSKLIDAKGEEHVTEVF